MLTSLYFLPPILTFSTSSTSIILSFVISCRGCLCLTNSINISFNLIYWDSYNNYKTWSFEAIPSTHLITTADFLLFKFSSSLSTKMSVVTLKNKVFYQEMLTVKPLAVDSLTSKLSLYSELYAYPYKRKCIAYHLKQPTCNLWTESLALLIIGNST